ncbi:MAG: hypothetical protein AAF203_06955 [Pseudomonadota bacterium]
MIQLFIAISLVFCFADDHSLALLRVRDLDDLIKTDQDIDNLKKLEKSCRLEQTGGFFPIHCFLLINHRLSKSPLDASDQKLWRQTNLGCVKSIDKIDSMKVLEKVQNVALFDRDCQVAVAERIKDLKYVEGDDL